MASTPEARWLARFKAGLGKNRTAERAWEKLKKAQLEAVAENCLFRYANPRPFDEEQPKLRNVIERLRAVERAAKIKAIKIIERDPRADLFSNRYSVKECDLLSAEMPFTFDGTTVDDWMGKRLAEGKAIPGPRGLRAAFASLGPRCPISDRKFWLHVLHLYALNASVKLGSERLASLAICSDPNSLLDPSTLARNLKLFSPAVESASRRSIRQVRPPFRLIAPTS